MSRLLIKPSKTEDFYVVWTTVSDGPIKWGTKEELSKRKSFLKMIFGKASPSDSIVISKESFARADEFGSANLLGDRSFYDWDSSEALLFVWDMVIDGFTADIFRSELAEFMKTYVQVEDNSLPPERLLEVVSRVHFHD